MNLEHLDLSDCESLKRLEQTKATGLEKLKYLNLSGCSLVETLPDLSNCRDLEGLYLHKCKSLKRLEQAKATGLEKLKYLNLSGCTSLESLPDLSSCRDLEDLNLSDCNSLTRLDEAIGSLENLVHLDLSKCRNLATVPSSLRSKPLQTLVLSWCFNVEKILAIMEKNEFLEALTLMDTAVRELPDSISNLVALKQLFLYDCIELTVIPCSIYKMRALQELKLIRCRKLSAFPRRAAGAATDVYGFPNLKSFIIVDCKLKDLEFLDDLTCFETLTTLKLSRNEFTHVPASISKFKNLQELGLDGCDRLVEVPELPNVPYLNVAETDGQQCFRVDLFNSRGLDSGNINRLLSLENVRGSVGAMSVIFPGEEFPHWAKFQSGEYGSFYRVSLPQEMWKDDLFGLALFISFGAVDASSPDDSIGCCKVEVMVNWEHIISHYCSGEVVGVHSWWVYIPCQSLVQRDGDLAPEVNITLRGYPFGVFELRRWGMRLLCKREEEDDLIKVLEDGDDNDDHPGLEYQSGWRTQLRLRFPEMFEILK